MRKMNQNLSSPTEEGDIAIEIDDIQLTNITVNESQKGYCEEVHVEPEEIDEETHPTQKIEKSTYQKER